MCVFFKLFALFFVINVTSALLFRPQSAAVKMWFPLGYYCSRTVCFVCFLKLFALFFVLNITSTLLFRPLSAAVKLSIAGILLSWAKAKCLLGWVLWLKITLSYHNLHKLHYWNPQGWSAAAGVVANTTFYVWQYVQVLNISIFIVCGSINLNALCTGWGE